MRDFVDISLSPSDGERPYLVFLFHDGVVRDVTRHADIAAVVMTCQQHGLPVVALDPQVRRELRIYGIEAHLPTVKTVGT